MADQRAYDGQPAMTGTLGQTLGLLHMLVEAAQLDSDWIHTRPFRLDTSLGQNDVQVLQCGQDLMTAALRRVWARTAWQMLFQEAPLVLVKVPKVKPAMS